MPQPRLHTDQVSVCVGLCGHDRGRRRKLWRRCAGLHARLRPRRRACGRSDGSAARRHRGHAARRRGDHRRGIAQTRQSGRGQRRASDRRPHHHRHRLATGRARHPGYVIGRDERRVSVADRRAPARRHHRRRSDRSGVCLDPRRLRPRGDCAGVLQGSAAAIRRRDRQTPAHDPVAPRHQIPDLDTRPP